MRVRVKFCGMTRSEDVDAAVRLGVDAVGLVFHAPSPRHLDIGQARALLNRLPAFVTATGLFLNPAHEQVEGVLEQLRLDLLQFHGRESPEFCRSFGVRYMKAVPMGGQVDIAEYARRYADAAALLFDSHRVDDAGGSGMRFDWSRVPAFVGSPVVLAGGLTPENVAAAIEQVQPYGVDVSSSLESSPGIKDARRMAEFMAGVNSVQRT